ncbi:VWA containing CoxE family protein [Desulfofarcimen acetoxidans DSM 771]|uniref:VWA containing CoxE family protein n=1 Tax=Desulfofarcimen acetoxidans (strain ATCC 49208 / DSM 771 / KCTC 5769 / VKM B-1644 / 5575) TaxID=485916 RepID=C8W251_DESAS|nr:VWA domain-containing protein [Desulfofarcimen acetoxidans]ACV61715.1 VWA containing CoxE family protein [Desulfofarcimen acetoxidans DSM 771]
MNNQKYTQILSEISSKDNKSLEYMVARFAHILRHLDVRVSASETIDALRALSIINIMDRDQVRAALRGTLVKGEMEHRIFDLAFNNFFLPPEEKASLRLEEKLAEQDRLASLQEAEEDFLASMQDGEFPWSEELLKNIRLTREQKETYAHLPEKEKQRLKEILTSFQGNNINNPDTLIAQVAESSLNFWRYHMLKNNEDFDEPEPLAPDRLTGEEEMDEVIERVSAEFFRDAGDNIMYQDMKNISDENLPRVMSLIKKMTKKLVTRVSRRTRFSKMKKTIDIRRSIRQNISYGGIPLELRYRAKRIQKPRLLLICDVSASMARYARFVIQFIYGLSNAVKDIESFIFSEDLERITPMFKRKKGFADTMTEIINQSGIWGQATDFNRSLETFGQRYQNLLTSETYLIIMSDTKTLAVEQAAFRLKQMKKNLRGVIWLNTLPRNEWIQYKSVFIFQQQSRMFECNTLAHLDKVMRSQIFSV